MPVFRSDISNSWWDKLGAFSGFCPLLNLLFRSPLGAVLGPSGELRWSLNSGTCGATGPGGGPPAREVSLLRTKLRLGMTWIFNFYLPIFCRKNILGVVWKEAHGFLSHYSGCAPSYKCEGGVSVCYNLGQMWELFFSWRVPKTRHGLCKHFTEGHSSLHGSSQPARRILGGPVGALVCDRSLLSQAEAETAHSLDNFHISFPLSKDSQRLSCWRRLLVGSLLSRLPK